MKYSKIISLLSLSFLIGCGSQDVPQARKARELDKTGIAAMWIGGKGFIGEVVGTGTYYTGMYNEYSMVNCSQETIKEPLNALTKDGVQFGLDVYTRFSANCTDDSVKWMLSNIIPEQGNEISTKQIYLTYVRPAIGASVREVLAPIIANDVNEKREEILIQIRNVFNNIIANQKPAVALINEFNLSALSYPEEMIRANTDRATQAILKAKAIAEREKVEAEIQTMEMRKKLAEADGVQWSAKIEKIGASLQKYPEYLQWDMQSIMTEIYRDAGAKGNMVIAAPSPQLFLQPKK